MKPYCMYCKRPLSPALPVRDTSFTFDHVKPQSEGGHRRVPCCRKCNMLKGNTAMEDWFWFIGAFARWWKTFNTPGEVALKIREERVRRAWAKVEGA